MIRVFIDIDNIVADFESAFRRFLNKKLHKKSKREDICEFDFYKCFKITKEEEKRLHNEFMKHNGYKKLKYVKGSIEGIKELREFCNIKFLTSRPQEIRDTTIKWFNKIKIPLKHEDLIFSRDKLNHEMKFDVIIEDRWEDALRLAQKNKKVILFDYPWNRKTDKNGNPLGHRNIIRIFNWKEIIESIENIAEEKFKDPIKDDNTMKIWKESISVQMHFNQLIMRNRVTLSTFIYAALGATLTFLRWEHTFFEAREFSLYISDFIIIITIVILSSYFWIDLNYYYNLLLGAVKFTEKMDKKHKGLGLTSSITKAIGHEKAKFTLRIYYLIIAISLIIIIGAKYMILL